MAITYPLTLPTTPSFRDAVIEARTAVSVVENERTFQQFTQDWGGQAWRMTFRLPKMTREVAAPWSAFFKKLNGSVGTFLASPADGKTAKGAGGGTPLVKGSGQTGNELDTDGWPAATEVLKAEDFIQLGSGASARLHQVLDDVTSDGSGNATLLLWPSLRESPADNSAIVYTNPVGVWKLEGGIPESEIGLASIHGLGFSAVEAV